MAGGNRCSSGAGDGVSDTGGACRPGAAARAYLTATRLLPPDAGPGSAASEACRQQLAAKLAAAQELLSDGQGAAVWAAEPQAVMPQLLRLSAPHPNMRDGAPHRTIPVLAGRQLAQLQLDAAHDIDATSTAAAVPMLLPALRARRCRWGGGWPAIESPLDPGWPEIGAWGYLVVCDNRHNTRNTPQPLTACVQVHGRAAGGGVLRH